MDIRVRFQKLVAFIAAKKERIGIIMTGHAVDASLNFVFNWIFSTSVIIKLGFWKGLGSMILVAFLVNIVYFKFYDWAKKDWLGIETIKSGKEYKGNSLTKKALSWLLRQSDPIIFLGLSIFSDPFKVTIYMRKGAHQYNGLGKRDWAIYTSSLIIGTTSLALTIFGGFKLILAVFK